MTPRPNHPHPYNTILGHRRGTQSGPRGRVIGFAASIAALILTAPALAQQADMHYYFTSNGNPFSFQDGSGPLPLSQSHTYHRTTCLSNGVCGDGDIQTDVDVTLGTVASIRARSQLSVVIRPNGPAPIMVAATDEANGLDFANLTATDVVFIDTANPGATGFVNVFVHMNVAASVQLSGGNTCGIGNRDGLVGCDIRLNGLLIRAEYFIRRDALFSNSFPSDWMPDGLPHPVRFGPFSVPLNTPLSFRISSTARTTALLCGPQPANVTTGTDVFTDSTLEPGDIVFETPATIVGNSVQMHIDRNVFQGNSPPPCLADFDRNGVVNSADFFDFLTAFFTITPAADFNHDGSVNSQDLFDFIAVFFSGC